MHDMTALIYCRVSSRKQLEGSGLDSQEHRCLAHAAQRHYPVEKVFLESASGGLQIDERPAMRDLLRYLDQHRDTEYVVIFDDHKRFTRQTEVHLRLRRELEQRGAKVEYLNFTIDNTPEGTFFETLLAAQAQLEREQNGRQTKEKTKARLERGYWTFRAPMGYKYVKSPQGGKELVREEPLASIITEALEGFASGHFASQAEMKRFLEHEPHFPKDLPDGSIRQQTVVRLLEQLLYAGYLEAPQQGVSFRKAQHEGLISLETFERIRQRRKNTAYLPARKDIHKDFPLRGAVCCAGCEKPLRSGWTKGNTKIYAYYLCQTRDCEHYGKSIARDKIEGEFESLLQTVQLPKSVIAITREMFKDAWDQQTARTSEAIRSFAQEARKVEKEISRLIERVMDANSPRVVQAYEERIDTLEKQKLLWEEKAAKTTTSTPSFDTMLELSLMMLANPHKLWRLGRFEMKRTVLKLAFPSPLYYDRKQGTRTPLKSAENKAFHAFLKPALQDGAVERT